jgi:hypothetical protein
MIQISNEQGRLTAKELELLDEIAGGKGGTNPWDGPPQISRIQKRLRHRVMNA